MQGARLHKTWAEVQGQVSSAIAAYDAATSGPTKWPRLTVFLQQQYGHMVADFVQKCEADAERKVGCCCCCCCTISHSAILLATATASLIAKGFIRVHSVMAGICKHLLRLVQVQ
jgi:hypothetical protein